MERVCSPRAHNGLPHVAHVGRSSRGRSLQSSPCPILPKSSSSCARNGLICASTAASISAQVACGCSLRHWLIPSTSLSPALTCCICSLRRRLFFLAFMLSFLSSFFLLVYHLPPCKKMKRTPIQHALRMPLRLMITYTFKDSAKNTKIHPKIIQRFGQITIPLDIFS